MQKSSIMIRFGQYNWLYKCKSYGRLADRSNNPWPCPLCFPEIRSNTLRSFLEALPSFGVRGPPRANILLPRSLGLIIQQMSSSRQTKLPDWPSIINASFHLNFRHNLIGALSFARRGRWSLIVTISFWHTNWYIFNTNCPNFKQHPFLLL